MRDFASLSARLALGTSFFYSVADRFGLLGQPGTPNVSWGSFARFTTYVGLLNAYLPKPIIPTLAVMESIIEFSFAILLLLGFHLRWISYASALLLLSFAVTMTFALGVGAPLGYSVFTASAAALMLGAGGSQRWSIDALLTRWRGGPRRR